MRVAGEKFEVAIDGRDWEGDEDYEEEKYLSEEAGSDHSGSLQSHGDEQYYSDGRDHDRRVDRRQRNDQEAAHLQHKVEELERELAIRDDEQQLLERKATILEQKIIQTAEAKHLESTNEGLAKLQARISAREYE